MTHTSEAIVERGRIVLPNFGLPEGQRVRVRVEPQSSLERTTIDSVRERLRGKAQLYVEPSEPMISPDDWEMTK